LPPTSGQAVDQNLSLPISARRTSSIAFWQFDTRTVTTKAALAV